MTDEVSSSAVEKKGIACLKCGHVRNKGEPGPPTQCPGCGAFYHKVAQRLAAGETLRPFVAPASVAATSSARPASDPAAKPTSPPNANLTACKDCGGQVSKRAETCPHCGAPVASKNAAPETVNSVGAVAPSQKRKGISFGTGLGAIAGTILLMAIALSDDQGSSSPAVAKKPPCGPEQKECYSQRHLMDAQRACRPEIEKLARYQAEWTYRLDGMFESYSVRTDGSILFIGNEVKFQNGFGAWSKQSYRCVYDPSDRSALATVSG
jgi:predicted  nucleic acid-binding Zn-ribbon protein